jgi:ferric-dicitrate binding protein FerR (iron transport regulator)
MEREFFIRYFEGTISDEEEKALLKWIEESEENRRVVIKERQLWDMLILNYPEETIALPSESGNSKRIGRRIFIELIKVAAVFFIAVLGSIYFLTDRKEIPQAWNTIEVPIGQRTQLTLADGTKVWLNAKTKFTFPDRFNAAQRVVKLDGEAIFDVTHNEKSPFIVETEKYNVRVLGTEFNVYAYKHSNSFEATLIRGKVMIEDHTAESKVELKPDFMAVYNSNDDQLDIRRVNALQSVFWREGIYSFENEPLTSIFQRLERYYEVEFDVRNKKIMMDNFTGKFRYRDSIDVILEVVKKSSRFRYSKSENKITIY